MARAGSIAPTGRLSPAAGARALSAFVAALAALSTVPACTTPATQFVITVATDLPPGSIVALRANVSDSAGHAGDAQLAPRGNAPDAGVRLPATFGVSPGAIARDGTFRVTVTASLAPANPTAPNLSLTWQAFLTFVPGLTQRAQVFLSRACSVVTGGCARAPAERCTRSALCDEMGMTCNAAGACVPVPAVQVERDAGTAVPDTASRVDAPVESCVPRCAGRQCGDDGCGAPCGACVVGATCDATSGRCVEPPPPCGHLGEPCCPTSPASCVDPSTACDRAGNCVPCGGRLQPCCAFGMCAASMMCTVGVCAPCGAEGEACCGGAVCAAPAYCNGGRCWAPPTLTDPSPEGPGCIDFGTPHAALAWTVRGRPGASGEKWAVHISCTGATEFIPPDSCFTIGPDGTFSAPLSNPVITDCEFSTHGEWRSYVIVDGQRSAESRGVFFNSTCPALDTCARGRAYCPSAAPLLSGRTACP